MEENKKTEIIDIYPIKKGKRMLIFLADFFIAFIVSILLYNLAVYPIYHVSSHYNETLDKASEAETHRNIILKNAKLLFYEDGVSDFNEIEPALSNTFSLYLKEYVINEPNKQYEVFFNYYSTDLARYISSYKQFNNDQYFNINENNIQLKDKYIEMFNPILDDKNGLSDEGNKEYETMFNKFFLVFYSRMMNDIKENDLIINNISYKAQQTLIDNANTKFDNMVNISTYISFALGVFVSYLLIPFTNKYKRTLGMIMMRYYRIDTDSLTTINNKGAVLSFIYEIFINLAFLMFIPLLTIRFEYMFNLTLNIWLSLASLFIILVSFIYLLFKKSNQTLIDSITHTAIIDNDSLDMIYRYKGYDI